MDLVFDLTIENRGTVPVTLFAFVWATNDDVDPPERGLWPLDAVEESLTERGELRVGDPTVGHELTLSGGESHRLESLSILQPIGWYEGERVLFKQLKVELWNADGQRLLEEVFSAPAAGQLPSE
ncbi:MAG: hypothetical protein JSU96_19000 [Acidobacteriota bacterium]|nr:MAG: hypothetical protein JSU96_19000 [Acidobacteriota bacterium]